MKYIILAVFYILVICLVKGSVKDVISRNLILCFCFFWLLALLLSIFNRTGIIDVSSYTYFLTFVNVLSFVLGFRSLRITGSDSFQLKQESIDSQIIEITNSKIFRTILIILLAYTTALFITNIQTVLIYQNMADLRTEYFESRNNLYGAHFGFIHSYFLNPFCVFCIPIFAYMCIYHRNWICLLIGVLLLEQASLSGGRFGYVRILCGFIFIVVCVLSKFISFRKRALLISVPFLITIVLVFATTFFRAGFLSIGRNVIQSNREDALGQVEQYLAGPIAAFNYSLENNYVDRIGGYQYGTCTLTAFDQLLQPFLNKINPSRTITYDKLVQIKQGEQIEIGGTMRTYNALYTAMLPFYADFGIIGIFIFPFIFGRLFRRSVSLLYKYPNIPMLVIVSWIFQKSMHSVFDYGFLYMEDILLLIALFIWGRKANFNSNSNYI